MLANLAKKILEAPAGVYDWSVQGLGMMRLYLSPTHRLHVWHNSLVVLGVTQIHDHPWDFVSTTVAGRLLNTRYVEAPVETGVSHMRATILCGQGACVRSEPRRARLVPVATEELTPGSRYSQKAAELHRTAFDDGTVTLIERTFTRVDVDHATVFWPVGQHFVSAEPRPATPDEVERVRADALRLFAEAAC